MIRNLGDNAKSLFFTFLQGYQNWDPTWDRWEGLGIGSLY